MRKKYNGKELNREKQNLKVIDFKLSENIVKVTTSYTMNDIKDYHYEQTHRIINNVQLGAYLNILSKEQIVQAVEYLNDIEYKWGRDEIHFSNNDEREQFINELLKGYDQYTNYIENYNQMKEAESANERISEKIKIIRELGYFPKVITKTDIRNIIFYQLQGALTGLEKRNDKVMMSHLVILLKKLGFEKAHVDNNTKTVHYMLKALSDNYRVAVEVCVSIENLEDDNYKVEVTYNYPNKTKWIEEGHKEIEIYERINYKEVLHADRGFCIWT